jgi:molecular chaperone GrpE
MSDNPQDKTVMGEEPGLPPVADEASATEAANSSSNDEWKNKAAYLAAEIDNMRKRFIRERGDLVKMANEELLKNLLPVFDNLSLGLKSIRDAEEALKDHKLFGSLLKGVDMTATHFEQTLDRVGVKAIESVGKTFDPNFHEAVGESADPTKGANEITGEFQKGFILHGRVLRPARVIVNKLSNA